MRNIWLVAVREFRVRVLSRGFILASIAVPVFLIVIWALTGVFDMGGPPGRQQPDPQPVREVPSGYVDQAGLVRAFPEDWPPDLLRAYPDQAAADAALAAGEIEAYYLIPQDYLETGQVRRVSRDLPAGLVDTGLIDELLARNLLPEASPRELARMRDPLGPGGPQFVPIAGEQQGGTGGLSFMPFLVTFIIMIPLFTSGGYLLQSLGQEKGNRVMEILLVSLTPRQILAGKLLGTGALTLVQYAFWVIVAGGALLLVGQQPGQMLAGINLTLQEGLFSMLYALGGFVLYAAFMAGLGAMAPNLEGGRSWVLLIVLPMMIPIYMWNSIVSDPNGALAVVLSLIPFSAPVGMLLRMTTTAVPSLQIGLSLLLLAVTAVGTVWLMARLFRVQTLLSGEALSFRRIWSALRSG